jgi:hypothetical protein
MKTQEELIFALKKKQEQLSEARTRIEELNVWKTANAFFGEGGEAFLEKLLTDKIMENTRIAELQGQITILKWCIE